MGVSKLSHSFIWLNFVYHLPEYPPPPLLPPPKEPPELRDELLEWLRPLDELDELLLEYTNLGNMMTEV